MITENEDFEYDVEARGESLESDTEDSEDSEDSEDYESDGEDTEAYRARGASEDEAAESDGEDTEDEQVIYQAREDSESDGEDMESDGETAEDVGASASFSASLGNGQRARDSYRRRMWANRIAATQQRETRRAAALQRSLANRLKGIRAAGPIRTQTVGRLTGPGRFQATLSNGRTAYLSLRPVPATLGEVNRLRAAFNANQKRAAAADAANSRAIAGLKSAQASAIKRLTNEQVRSDKELSRRVLEGDNRLDKRISSELTGQNSQLGKFRRRMMRLRQLDRRQAIANNLLLATAFPLFAAYGDRTSPIAKNNLILTGSLAFWLLGDEVAQKLFQGGKESKGWGTGLTAWSYFAPVGNAVTSALFFEGKQNDRFLSGTADVADKAITVTVPLRIAKRSAEDFKKLTPPVVVSLVSGDATEIEAEVKDGNLILTRVANAGPAKVAFIVDTHPPAA